MGFFDKLKTLFSSVKLPELEFTAEDTAPSITEIPTQVDGLTASFSNVNAVKTRSLEFDRFVRYRDYERMCLTGDTEISLVGKRKITLKEWTEKYSDIFFYVYSVNLNNGKIYPALARIIGKVGKKKILKLTLSNGKILKCTPDHRILLKNLTYKEAKDIIPEKDILFGFFRKFSDKKVDKLDGYEMIYLENYKKWFFTHRLFMNLEEYPKNYQVHHLNKNILDNRPENLVIIDKKSHLELHKSHWEAGVNSALQYFNGFNNDLISQSQYSKDILMNLQEDVYLSYNQPIKILKIEELEEEEVYDVSVPIFNNFALSCGIFVHNSMDTLCGLALETYADEMTQTDEYGNVIQIETPDKRLTAKCENFLINRLNINSQIWEIAYNMAKWGDNFTEIIFNKELNDIVKIKQLSPFRVFKIYEKNKLKGYRYIPLASLRILGKPETEILQIIHQPEWLNKITSIEPFRIVSFKINSTKYFPYGVSVFDSARLTWRQLELLEDAVIVSRLVRSPVRFKWKIYVGKLAPSQAWSFVNKVKDKIRKEKTIDPFTGKTSARTHAISMVEDFWLPFRENAQNDIEVLDTGKQWKDIADLEYLEIKLLRYLRIPPAFFQDKLAEGISGKTLSMIDMKFARRIERLQQFLIEGLYKILSIYLIISGLPYEYIKEIKIKMPSPSPYLQTAKFERLTKELDLIKSAKEIDLFPNVWILQKILDLDEKEIYKILYLKELESQNKLLQYLAQKLGLLDFPDKAEDYEDIVNIFKRELGNPSISKYEMTPELIALKSLLGEENRKKFIKEFNKLSPKDKSKVIAQILILLEKTNKLSTEMIKDIWKEKIIQKNLFEYHLLEGEYDGLIPEKDKYKILEDIKTDTIKIISETKDVFNR